MKCHLVLFLFLLVTVSVSWGAEAILIVHPQNPNDSISQKDAEKIYFNKKTSWDDGSSITPYAQKDPAIQRLFVEQVLGKSMDRYILFWRKAIFTGKGTPPKEVEDNAAVKQLVASNPQAIGYITTDALDDSVKKLTVK